MLLVAKVPSLGPKAASALPPRTPTPFVTSFFKHRQNSCAELSQIAHEPGCTEPNHYLAVVWIKMCIATFDIAAE